MSLAGFQKRHLRALVQTRRPDARIGNKGLSDGMVAHLEQLLRAEELIKVRFGGAREQLEAVGLQVAAITHAELVGLVGNSLVLYRAKPEGGKISVPQ